MISSLLIGGVSSLISKYASFREEKAKSDLEIQKEKQRQDMELEKTRIQLELGLDIEKEKTRQSELEALKCEINAIKDNRNQIAEIDKIVYSKMDKTVLNVIALMKPIITYTFLAIILGISIWGCFTSNSEQYKSSLEILSNLGIIELAEVSIGFWFGALGVDMMGGKRKI